MLFLFQKVSRSLSKARKMFKIHPIIVSLFPFFQMTHLISPYVFLFTICCTCILSLNLYQIMLLDLEVSKIRSVKLLSEFITVLVGYFMLVNVSEISDDCNGLLRRALIHSAWVQCSYRTQRDLCILLRRVQKPNHLKFYSGAIVLSRVFFLRNMKVAYSFVNYMRLNVQRE